MNVPFIWRLENIGSGCKSKEKSLNYISWCQHFWQNFSFSANGWLKPKMLLQKKKIIWNIFFCYLILSCKMLKFLVSDNLVVGNVDFSSEEFAAAVSTLKKRIIAGSSFIKRNRSIIIEKSLDNKTVRKVIICFLIQTNDDYLVKLEQSTGCPYLNRILVNISLGILLGELLKTERWIIGFYPFLFVYVCLENLFLKWNFVLNSFVSIWSEYKIMYFSFWLICNSWNVF